ncbi:hypothetical protein UA38_16625 [Photobacterium kishitanii]|uniref:DUF3592 domain-containing protein n=1 Tax=Photobacterium kishitanii TaxID=318456 RepID=A0AAX0YWI9_9GAMM|nr:DUF3592 domain-containing protein [Photobacterium kishitanii]KJG55992.1 hypothetical protein UA38_16625 [Photobacterium kishitanii]KJG62848.1 hypothetical protein UA42_00015 [Photobacterium kishitanii]KJG64188.1 hypothetical protein UA40_17750 [Photobacterium kishitanii]KJG68755.1 hypothetical protein UA41_15035 [Photobacterium kishitanii]PSX20014.1 DUF3592 domain-containing protein [Photobacterium kishitanii]
MNIKKIKIFVSIIGVCFLTGSVFSSIITFDFIKSAVTGSGEIIRLAESRSDNSVSYAPVVYFSDSNDIGYEFTSSVSSNPPSYQVGEFVEVMYLESNPNEAKINGYFSLWGLSLILAFLGVVFSSIGFGMLVFDILKNRKGNYLVENGLKVKAKFSSVEINYSLQVNGRNPYRIVAEWLDPESNNIYIYKSKNLWFDPTDYIRNEYISVYVDKVKLKKHYLDVSFLPTVVE